MAATTEELLQMILQSLVMSKADVLQSLFMQRDILRSIQDN